MYILKITNLITDHYYYFIKGGDVKKLLAIPDPEFRYTSTFNRYGPNSINIEVFKQFGSVKSMNYYFDTYCVDLDDSLNDTNKTPTTNQAVFNTSLKFNSDYEILQVHTLTEDINFTVNNSVESIPGSIVMCRIVGDGTSLVNFTMIKEISTSAGFDVTEGILNYLVFFYDGVNYFVNIYQDKNATPVDLAIPILQSAIISDNVRNRIILLYNENLNTLSIPDTTDFSLNISGKNITNVDIDQDSVILTTSTNFVYGDNVELTYTSGDSPIMDESNNIAENIIDYNVTNNITAPDSIAPTLETATVSDSTPDEIILTFSESLNEIIVPSLTDFTVSGKTVSSIDITNDVVTLTVNSPYEFGDIITLSYTAGINPLQDGNGNEVEDIVTESVTNNISAGAQILTFENLVNTTNTLDHINYGVNLPSGGRGILTIDTTQPFEVYAQFTSLSPATVLMLDRDSANGYTWTSQIFEAGVYHITGQLYWAINGNTPNTLGVYTPPGYVKFSKSGNDIILSTCATEFGSYVTVKTFVDALVGVPTLYVHVLFAFNNPGDKIQVKYII